MELTPRQREVVKACAAGKTPKQIAFQMGISSRRVNELITRICLRIGITGRHELMVCAIAGGECLHLSPCAMDCTGCSEDLAHCVAMRRRMEPAA